MILNSLHMSRMGEHETTVAPSEGWFVIILKSTTPI